MARRLVLLPLAALLALSFGVSTAAAAHTTFTTTLSGAEEVPGPGDPNGKGFITVGVYPDGRICYEAKLQAIGRDLVGAHIHEAPAGEAGPVVVDLMPSTATRRGNVLSTCVATTAAQAAEIVANPTDYYVNIHTPAFPGGAIRGQLGD